MANHRWRRTLGRLPTLIGICVGMASVISLAPAVAQTQVVQPEDVTAPTPSAVALPTPTSTPATSASTGPTAAIGHEVEYGSAIYVVREGDTLWTAALEMGLDLDVMPCVVRPFFGTDEPLVIGNELLAPAGELICHEVSAGETVTSIAAKYGVEAETLLADGWNELGTDEHSGAQLEPGRYVRIVRGEARAAPSGFFASMLDRSIEDSPMMALARGGPLRSESETLVPENWPYGSGQFEWPSPGWLTQGYRNDHRAVDIAAPLGTVVTAADRGVVVLSGWNNQGYGNFVVIDHNIDYVTLYSHLDEIFVEEGEVVAKGQPLGTVGSTGNSTGPHLHFEVRDFGSRINPLEVLVRE